MTVVLVTGGAGFLGSHFVQRLFERYPGYRVRVLDALTYAGSLDNLPEEFKDSPRFEFVYGSVDDAALVDHVVSEADLIVHFAAESHVARSIFSDRVFFETDVLGTQRLASAAVRHGRLARFVHVSSSEVYGSARSEPMDEEHPLAPLTPYASAKAGADRLIYSYWRTYGLPAVILRPFNQYGPRQHLEKVLPRFVTSALLDRPLTVHGEGLCRRDWGFVEDTCEAVDLALHAPDEQVVGEALNIGAGVALDVRTLACKVVEALGKSRSLIRHIPERPGQVEHHRSSTERAAECLGWRSRTPFDEGLARTIDWYRRNEGWWRGQLYMSRVPLRLDDGSIEYY